MHLNNWVLLSLFICQYALLVSHRESSSMITLCSNIILRLTDHTLVSSNFHFLLIYGTVLTTWLYSAWPLKLAPSAMGLLNKHYLQWSRINPTINIVNPFIYKRLCAHLWAMSVHGSVLHLLYYVHSYVVCLIYTPEALYTMVWYGLYNTVQYGTI